MATWRTWRINLVILVAVAAGILTAACSSNPERVVTEPGGDEQSDEVAPQTEAIESFLSGTVWIVDDLDTITPYGPDSDVPALSFTTETGLVLTMTDACGSLRLGLFPDGSGSHMVERDDNDLEICDDLFGRFFAEATLLTLERNDARLIVRSGSSVLRASHVVSDSIHPGNPVEEVRVPWCSDVDPDTADDFSSSHLQEVQRRLAVRLRDAGLAGTGIGNRYGRVNLSFVDPPEDEWADIVESLPEAACVESVGYTPDIPTGVQLLAEDGEYVGPVELVPVGLYVEQSPSPDARTLTILGTETACNSGQAMGDRMRGPAMVETADRVVIAVGVVPNLLGGNCPSNPIETFEFELDQPVGDRVLWNAIADEPIDGDPYR